MPLGKPEHGVQGLNGIAAVCRALGFASANSHGFAGPQRKPSALALKRAKRARLSACC